MLRWLTLIALVLLPMNLPMTVVASPQEAVTDVVTTFVAAGDTQNADQIDTLLADGFQTTFSVGESGQIIVISRQDYLEGIRAKKFGGDKRNIEVESAQIVGPFAVVHVRLNGARADFNSIYSLVKKEENWQLVSDMSVFLPKKQAP